VAQILLVEKLGAPGFDSETWKTTNLNWTVLYESYTDPVMGAWSFSYDAVDRLTAVGRVTPGLAFETWETTNLNDPDIG
jgi:hypothetical protein